MKLFLKTIIEKKSVYLNPTLMNVSLGKFKVVDSNKGMRTCKQLNAGKRHCRLIAKTQTDSSPVSQVDTIPS